jgi:hypothetical protein
MAPGCQEPDDLAAYVIASEFRLSVSLDAHFQVGHSLVDRLVG